MPTLDISNLTKAYGDNVVLHGISVTIADGEFVSLIGSSGCGKSTLLRTIAGLESITDGTISMDGRIINTLPPKDRDIAMVFQNYALYPHLTVAENMGFSLKLRKVDKATARKAVEEAAELLGLTDYLDRPPRALSGGQRQRVAMGRAIVRNPKVFLFDEPLSNLDAKLRVSTRAQIKNLHHELRTTTIYVTHDQIEAMTLADRIVVLRDGRIEQVGTPKELYARPANVFVAQFIGSPKMNVVPVSAVAPALERAGIDTANADRVGMRPEHLTVSENGLLSGKVVVSEYTGAGSLLHVEIDNRDVLLVASEGQDAPDPGTRVQLAFSKADLHLFDSDGLAITREMAFA